MKGFQKGLVFKAHRLLYHSTLGSRVIKKTKGSGFRVQGSGYRVQGSGYRVQGTGFRVQEEQGGYLRAVREEKQHHVRVAGRRCGVQRCASVVPVKWID